MKKRITALLAYAIFWLLFFFSARFFFILTHYSESAKFPFRLLAETFIHGFRLDLSATGYIFLIPVLLMVPGIWIQGNWYKVFLRWYTYIFVVISAIIIVSDTLLYKYWGFRMDYTVFIYLKTPKEAAASVSLLQTGGILFSIIIISAIFIFIYRKVLDGFFDDFMSLKYPVPGTLFFMLFLGSLIIPIRGGLGVAPINAGTVYFSSDIFINHSAVNVAWNVGSSVFNRKPSKNPYQYLDIDSARKIAASLVLHKSPPLKVLNNNRPNLLFIVLESFGSTMVGPLGGDSLTTPCFNRYIKEGILFTRFYASGNRTDKAMPAILNGYPAQPAVSIMKEPKKTQSLPGIVKMMISLGYYSSFWYGGEINFANFNSFVINSGFQKIVTQNDFSPENYNAKWGVHDHVLFQALADTMQNISEPFIKVVLTLSSHEPFDVPIDPVFKGNDEISKYKNSVYYTDKALGSFLDRAKTLDWWKNTLVILVADHCRRNSSDVLAYSGDIFRIPMLWLGGALEKENLRIDKMGSQVDIPLTILHQLELNDGYPFAKDLLSDESGSFAFYTFNEGFAFITDSSEYIYDHKYGDAVVKEGKNPGSAGEYGKAYLQVLFDDFLHR